MLTGRFKKNWQILPSKMDDPKLHMLYKNNKNSWYHCQIYLNGTSGIFKPLHSTKSFKSLNSLKRIEIKCGKIMPSQLVGIMIVDSGKWVWSSLEPASWIVELCLDLTFGTSYCTISSRWSLLLGFWRLWSLQNTFKWLRFSKWVTLNMVF